MQELAEPVKVKLRNRVNNAIHADKACGENLDLVVFACLNRCEHNDIASESI